MLHWQHEPVTGGSTLDKDIYSEMVRRAHEKLRSLHKKTQAYDETELFVYTLDRLRDSWRDAHPGQGEPHFFFTNIFSLSTDGLEGTFMRAWVDLFLDDVDAARAVFNHQISEYDHCVKHAAACCGADRPIICSFDARRTGAPQSADIGCFATLCHTCLKTLPLKF